ncbi:glycosyltransferase [Flavobacterium ponti]|uniref:Glycosyltransferase n=1 Tax=Flavobacterium ponti TaxID=665133 RepID=A0ABV9P2D4_9FLAO
MALETIKPLRICLVSVSLSGGGAERCAANLSNYFLDKGHLVHHVVFAGEIKYKYSGELLHLETLKDSKNSYFSRYKRFKALKKYFNVNSFDVVVDFRVKELFLQEFIISNYVYNKSTLIYSIRSFMTNLYFPNTDFLSNLIYKNAKKIVTVSKSIEDKVHDKFKTYPLQTIYNPIDFEYIDNLINDKLDEDFNYVLAIGRMSNDVKQLDKLIETYAASDLPLKNIKLILLGEGILKEEYEKLALKLHLQEKIIFKGNVLNPFIFMKYAKIVLLTSKNEGFPNVILESLACETPVIAFDCQSGPSEIIIQNENGILVENQNFEAFKVAMNEMVSNKDLYLHCKQNARSSVERFSLENIGNQWLQLFNELK